MPRTHRTAYRHKLTDYLAAFPRVLALVFATLLSAGVSINASGSNARIGDFTLLDHTGRSHQLSWYSDQKAVVLFVQGNGCPIVRNGSHTLKAIGEEFKDQDVTFLMLNPQPQDNRDSIAKEANEFGYSFPVLLDEAQLVAQSLGVDRTAEVFIIDPKSREVLYRGPVDDRLGYETQKPKANNHYLRDALTAVVDGRPVAANTPEAPGCLISYPAKDAHAKNPVSYSKDVAPILEKHCVSCHHEGGIGPWAMTNHAMVQGWSRMMKEVLMTRRMPPGQFDAHASKPIIDGVVVTPQELQTLVHWIDAGAPMAPDETDPLPALEFDPSPFTLGEPDLVYEVPPQTIPATGVLDYRYIPVELNLDRDVWIRAIEFAPGDRKVLHHVITYLQSPADKSARARQNESGRDDSIGGFAPGRQPDIFRDNSGRLIRKGSNFLLQMHYTTSGKETVDATRIGLYLYDEPPAYVMSGGVAGQRRFLIPPHAKEHTLEGNMLIEQDAYLYGMMPHMHFRGRYMTYSAVYPDGTEELLLSVPKYEFNWQFSYQLEEPLLLPAGTRLVTRGAMDNSAQNPYNPDPTRPVRFGLQTMHEMFFGFVTLRFVGDTPESVTGASSEAVSQSVSTKNTQTAQR
ncbi:MAG: redoxin domain-containing protein [Halioglobus sp.]